MNQGLEVISAGDEVSLTIQFQQYSNPAAVMDVRFHAPIGGLAARSLGSRGEPFFAQTGDRVFKVTSRSLQRLTAV